MFASAMLLALLVLGPSDPAAPEIRALAWFNNPEYRLHDEREVILFFFEARDRTSARLVPSLNRLHRRPDVLVIGLTRDSRGAVVEFIRRQRVLFTIGAQSKSAREFGITKLPALVRVRGPKRADMERLDPDELGKLAPDWGPHGEENVEAIHEPWELKAFIESDAYGRNRRNAALKLYGMTDADSFEQFGERHLPFEGDPWVRSAIEFLMSHPTPQEIQEQKGPAPAVEFWKAYHGDPNAPEWAPVKRYHSGTPVGEQTVGRLARDYWNHDTESASDLVIRRSIAMALNGRHGESREQARAALLDMIPAEPDWAIRLYLAGALLDVCDVGDTEVADFLEAESQHEPHFFVVKPMMQYMSYYLRTGEEDARHMEPPPCIPGADD